MTVPRSLLLLSTLSIVALGCGGRVIDESADPGDAAVDVTGDAGTDAADTLADLDPDAPLDRCSLSDGTPLCGVAGCPTPSAPECEKGCLHFCSESDDPVGCPDRSSFGYCTGFIAKGPRSAGLCDVCLREGDVCARGPWASQLYCVPPEVCLRLEREGQKGACTWQDKSNWSSKSLGIPEVSCPADGASLGMCGSHCGACPAEAVCTGRSPLHPVGVCVTRGKAGQPGAPCGTGGFTCSAGNVCMRFKVPSEQSDPKLVEAYGFCVERERCRGLREHLPGGVTCKTTDGAEIP